MSSQHEFGNIFAAIKAKDGTYATGGSLAHSLKEQNPWWRWNLLERHYIVGVRILNRASELLNFEYLSCIHISSACTVCLLVLV